MRFLAFIFVGSLFIAFISYFKFKNYIPILMYHRLANNPGDRNSLPPEKFEEQLAYLQKKGYKTVSPEEFWIHYNRRGDLPKKSVMLTFDDAYLDTYTVALPLLKKYNMTATLFPISNWIGKTNNWENMGKAPTETMNKEQLLAWLDAGMHIAPHSVNHPFMTQCSDEELIKELTDSKVALEALTGRPMEYFCYPYGDVNEKVAKAAKVAGYKLAFAIFENAPIWTIDPMRLPRTPIPSHQSIKEFAWKVGNLNALFPALRKAERFFKKHVRK